MVLKAPTLFNAPQGKGKQGGGSTGSCKWCQQGECWTHGQIQKPSGKGKGKASVFSTPSMGGSSMGDSSMGGGGGGDLAGLGMLLGMMGGGGGGGLGGLGALMGLLAGGQGGGGKGKGGGKGWTNTFKVDKSGGELGEFTGKIKRFFWSWNYGFIECPELADWGDIFMHGNMKGGYREGQIVKFTCVINKHGKPQAVDLKSGLK